MEQKVKINFQQERDFGTIFSDTLSFLKQNFKSFFSSVILIVGPIILVMGLAYAFIQTTIMSAFTQQRDPSNPFGMFTQDYFMALATIMLCGFISNILLSAVSYNYLALYQEKPIDEPITVSEVAKRVWDNIGRLLISSLVFLLVVLLTIGVLVLVSVGLFSGMGIGFIILICFLLFIAAAIIMPVISYFIPASFYVVVRDNLFIFPAMAKVKKYLSGNFWWTWLIMVVAMIALGILQGIFNLPATILSMGKMFSRISSGNTESDSSILLMVFYTLGMFLTYCMYSITHIIAAFNFMSHEEKHEGKGMMAQIESI